jgi:hypothetical protein
MMIDGYRGEAEHCGRLSLEEEKGIRRLKRRRKVRITGERVWRCLLKSTRRSSIVPIMHLLKD